MQSDRTAELMVRSGRGQESRYHKAGWDGNRKRLLDSGLSSPNPHSARLTTHPPLKIIFTCPSLICFIVQHGMCVNVSLRPIYMPPAPSKPSRPAWRVALCPSPAHTVISHFLPRLQVSGAGALPALEPPSA